MRFFVSLTFTLVGYLASCGSDPDAVVEDVAEDADTAEVVDYEILDDADAEMEVKASCGEPSRLAFVTTDYSTGSAGLVSLEGWSSRPDLITIHSDAVVHCSCGRIVVIERLNGDNLTILTADSMTLIDQISLGASSNPHDAWIWGEMAYVTLYDEGRVVEVDLEAGGLTGNQLDLTGLADEDGNPEASMSHGYEERLYVTMQLLDRNTDIWRPTSSSMIAVIDVDQLSLVGTIELEGLNPTTDFVEGEDEGIVYLGHAGDWTSMDDGGIERVDLNEGESMGMIISGATLGGNIVDFVIVNEDLGYATVNDPAKSDRFVSFNPSTGEVLEEILTSTSGYTLVDLVLDHDGHVLITDRDYSSPGIRVFDIATNEEVVARPIDTGIPPFSMCLVPEPYVD